MKIFKSYAFLQSARAVAQRFWLQIFCNCFFLLSPVRFSCTFRRSFSWEILKVLHAAAWPACCHSGCVATPLNCVSSIQLRQSFLFLQGLFKKKAISMKLRLHGACLCRAIYLPLSWFLGESWRSSVLDTGLRCGLHDVEMDAPVICNQSQHRPNMLQPIRSSGTPSMFGANWSSACAFSM